MGSDNALKDGTRAQLHSISLSRGRCGRAALLPAVSLLLMLVAVHFWCDCIPSLDLAEVCLAFVGMLLPCSQLLHSESMPAHPPIIRASLRSFSARLS